MVQVLVTTSPSQVKEIRFRKTKYFPGPESDFLAISWCGYLLYSVPDSITASLKRHETIHLVQAREFKTWAGYYLDYLKYWILGLTCMDSRTSYLTNPYELEAYTCQKDPKYLSVNRRPEYLLKCKSLSPSSRARMYEKYYGDWDSWKKSIKTLS